MNATLTDPSSLVAIDFHVHAHASVRAETESTGRFEAMGEYFKAGQLREYTVPEIAEYYRSRDMACVVFGVDAMAERGEPMVPSNDEIAELAALDGDVLIPFASIDPHRGRAGIADARRLIEEGRVRGFKFHPNVQGFAPNDRLAYGLYEVIAEHGLIALFHSGHTGVGATMPGGDGIRLKYSNPMFVDDVAVDFPEMPIILAHPSFPWQDEALSVALHKPNVHIDLSGWSPKYFPQNLIQYANTLLQDKILFGSDFPVITPDRWLSDFAEIGIRDEVRRKILVVNAARLLGIEHGVQA